MDAEDQESVHEMMFRLGTWFFSIDTLTTIANYTNDKATEMVHKTRHRDENGRVFYKVDTHTYVNCRTGTCALSHSREHICRCIKHLCLEVSPNNGRRTGHL